MSNDHRSKCNTVLTLAARTMGVGSASCGPRPLDEYTLWSDPAAFSYVLRLLPAGTKSLPAAGRKLAPQNRVKPVVGTRDASGQISLHCATEGAAIEYSSDQQNWDLYTAPVSFSAKSLSVRATKPGMLSFQGIAATASQKLSYAVFSASSYQLDEGEPWHAIDGDTNTIWHTRWSGEPAQPPHSLIIDLKKELTLSAIVCTRRVDHNNGRIKDYEIYLSNDPKSWGEPAAKGTFELDPVQNTITLKQPIKARYLKLVALSEQFGKPFATLAELQVIESK